MTNSIRSGRVRSRCGHHDSRRRFLILWLALHSLRIILAVMFSVGGCRRLSVATAAAGLSLVVRSILFR